MEFLGAKGSLFFGYMYVGYVKTGGISVVFMLKPDLITVLV